MKNGFLNTFTTECKAFLQSPKRMFYTLIFPLMLFAFLSAIFYNGVPRDLPVAYMDQDQTQMSVQLIRMLDATSSIKMARVSTSDIEASQWMQQEKIYAYIVIPQGFQKKIYQGLSEEVLCYTNNQFLLPSGLIQKDFQQVVGTFSAGVSIKRQTASGIQINQAIGQVQPIRTDVHALFNPYSNYAFYLLTALLPMMLQMIVMMVTVYVIGVEFKYQNGNRWYHMSNQNAFAALLGKLLPYTLSLFFVGWWMNYLLFRLLGVPLQTGMWNVTLMTFLLIIIYQLIGVSIASVFRNFRSALTIGSGFTAIALSFAAYTFPIEGLPKSMQYMAEVFPFTHFIEYFIKRAVKGVAIELTWQPLVAMSLFVFVFVLSFPAFVNRLKLGGYE